MRKRKVVARERERYIIVERYADNGELSHRALVDSTDGRELGTDGGEPEDQSFWRDWVWVPDELNKAQATVEALQAQLVTLKRHAGLDCGDQSCLYALEHSGMRTNGGCRCSPKRMKDDLERSRKAVEALQRERDFFETAAATANRMRVDTERALDATTPARGQELEDK